MIRVLISMEPSAGLDPETASVEDKFKSSTLRCGRQMAKTSADFSRLLKEIRALSPEERIERARSAAKVRFELDRGRQEKSLRKLPRD